MKKYYYNKLLATESFNLGRHELNPIRIMAMTTTRIDQGIEQDEEKKVLGVPLNYKDKIKSYIRIDTLKEIQETIEYPEKFRDQGSYTFEIGIDYEFTIQEFTHAYFSTLDVFAEVGGLWATIKLLIKMLLPWMILKFMFAFAQIIRRKANQKVKISRIKDIKNQTKLIREKIKEKMDANPDDQSVQE